MYNTGHLSPGLNLHNGRSSWKSERQVIVYSIVLNRWTSLDGMKEYELPKDSIQAARGLGHMNSVWQLALRLWNIEMLYHPEALKSWRALLLCSHYCQTTRWTAGTRVSSLVMASRSNDPAT
ncbi:hypothetical protein WAI453_003142 [Rhynchosporium graminicola]